MISSPFSSPVLPPPKPEQAQASPAPITPDCGTPVYGDCQLQPHEMMIAELPRVSCCLTQAGTGFDQNRIDVACEHLHQASVILQALLAAVVSATTDRPAELAGHKPEAAEELPQSMAAAA